MRADRFDAAKHWPQVSAWREAWRIDDGADTGIVPTHGVVVGGVMAVFLWPSGPMGFVESLVRHPEATDAEMAEATLVAFAELAALARDLGVRCLVGITQLRAVIARAESFGFEAHPTPFAVVVRRL